MRCIFEGSYKFALLFVTCAVNSRAATKHVIQAKLVYHKCFKIVEVLYQYCRPLCHTHKTGLTHYIHCSTPLFRYKYKQHDDNSSRNIVFPHHCFFHLSFKITAFVIRTHSYNPSNFPPTKCVIRKHLSLQRWNSAKHHYNAYTIECIDYSTHHTMHCHKYNTFPTAYHPPKHHTSVIQPYMVNIVAVPGTWSVNRKQGYSVSVPGYCVSVPKRDTERFRDNITVCDNTALMFHFTKHCKYVASVSVLQKTTIR